MTKILNAAEDDYKLFLRTSRRGNSFQPNVNALEVYECSGEQLANIETR